VYPKKFGGLDIRIVGSALGASSGLLSRNIVAVLVVNVNAVKVLIVDDAHKTG